jgi:tape measure domain-containing protein
VPVVTDTLVTLLQVDGLGAWSASFARASSILSQFGGVVDATAQRTILLAAGAAAGAGLLAAGIGKAVQEAGNLEQIRIGFETVFGSATAADAKIKELQDFAAKTPFNFEQTANLSRQLVAMGVAADDVIPTMTDLGDAVSALGLGQDALARIAFNFGQIKTQGRLTGREMRDFAMNGIPVFDILQKKLGLNADQMRRIGDQGISADVALKALREGLHERFGGAMEKQNKTLFGSLSNLQDSAQRAGAAIGSGFLLPATALVRALTSLLDLFNALPGPIKSAFGVALGIAVVGLAAMSVGLARSIFLTTSLAVANARLAQSYTGVAAASSSAAKGIGLGIGLAAGGQALNSFSNQHTGPLAQIGSQLGFIGSRAGIGAGIGSVIPGVGTALGGIGGAIEGTLETIFNKRATGFGGTSPNDPQQKILDELKKQTAQLEKVADNGFGADASFMPIGVQRGMMRRMGRSGRS